MTKSEPPDGTPAGITHTAPIRVGVHEAKTRLSELLRSIEGGQSVEILRNGRPVARLVLANESRERSFGADRGVYRVPDDFDAALPGDLLDAFTGSPG